MIEKQYNLEFQETLAFLVLDAGEAAVPPVCDPLLVEGDVGHEPGGLQEEDRGQGDGTTNAEGLQSRQDLEKQII